MILSSDSSPPSMMTPESDAGSPLSMSPSLQTYDPRAIIRQLLESFTKEEITQLVEEESCTSLSVHGQLATEPSFSRPFLSLEKDGVYTHATPIKHMSVGHQNCGPKPSRSLSSNASLQRSRRQSATERGTGVSSATQRLDYACGFCAEENIRKTCTRRNDLRRHIENFHNSNAMWFCQHPGCKMTYDWQTAYQNHLRTAHGRSHMNVDEAKVKLCPQTVFACGFENCTQIFEAPNDDDTAATLKEYSGHIVKHFEEGSNGGRWTYSSRIRNLLRQRKVSAFWQKTWPELERSQLQWEPQSSMAARKTLEAGHVENLPFLMQIMIVLASNPGDLGKMEGKLDPPFRNRCTRAQYQHRLSHDSSAQSPQPVPERDGSQFKVSGEVGIEYGPYTSIQQAGQQVPRSLEPFDADHTMNQGRSRSQGQAQGQGQYHDGTAPLHPLTPPQLFYHCPSSALYSQSSQMISTAMPPQQHAPEQYLRVGSENESVVSAVGFPGMHQVASIPGAMDIEMNHDGAHTPTGGIPNDRRGNWINYQQMAMHPPLPADGYDMSNPVTPEHVHNMAGRYDSPAGSL